MLLAAVHRGGSEPEEQPSAKLKGRHQQQTIELQQVTRTRETLRRLLNDTGVSFNGGNAFDIQVHDERFYDRVLSDGAIGFGESYMDGWWDCEALDVLLDKILRADLESRISPVKLVIPVIYSKLVNRQRRARAFNIGRRHYDLGNDLYVRMLDRRMTYTCGYWKDAADLDTAQEHKLDLACRKLELEHGMRVLDIGCGWGSKAAPVQVDSLRHQARIMPEAVPDREWWIGLYTRRYGPYNEWLMGIENTDSKWR